MVVRRKGFHYYLIVLVQIHFIQRKQFHVTNVTLHKRILLNASASN